MKPGELSWQVYGFEDLDVDRLYRILQLRQRVFIVEQTCVYEDLDGLDPYCFHLCGWRDDTLLAYMRCLPPGLDYTESAMGRIVVDPAGRGLNLGRELVRRGIAFNRATWPRDGIRIGAQAQLEDFYCELGFEAVSDIYDEDGIPHIKMLFKEAG